jgi:hypothetical protein
MALLIQVQLGDRRCTKTEYFFLPEHVPDNYNEVTPSVDFWHRATVDMDGRICRAPLGQAAEALATETETPISEAPISSAAVGCEGTPPRCVEQTFGVLLPGRGAKPAAARLG